MVDPAERFADLVQGPESGLPLDEAALLIAALDHPVDVPAQLDALDALAADLGADDVATLAHALFVTRGFVGNTDDYGDPRNSYLDDVLRRRLGIPITLSVLMIEVGRRRGIALVGVGMPGHFLVGSDDGYVDPFHGGVVLDATGARRLFDRTHPGAPFSDHYLDPVGPRAVLSRMLANLVATFLGRDPMRAIGALRLRLTIPGLPEPERRQGEETLVRLRARLN
jgi:regulator of sirC expression with transglutaminase-like and TPR domain